MPENWFDLPPSDGPQVLLTNSGSAITPYRVTVTNDGLLVFDQVFTLKADAQRVYDDHKKAVTP